MSGFVPQLSDDLPGRQRLVTILALSLIVVTVVGAAVRVVFLIDHPMRYDESYNYMHFSSHSPAFIATHYLPNNHVFHTLLVKLASHFLGNSPAVLRLPAFVAGVLLIPVTAWLGWSLSRNRFVALLSAVGVCASSPLIEYSANARGYSWLALFTTLSVICTLHLLSHPAKRRLWVCWGVLGAFGAYTVPLMLLPVTGLSLVLLGRGLCAPRGSATRRAMACGLITGLGLCAGLTFALYLPIVLTEGVDSLRETNHMVYAILGRQVESFGSMVLSIWELVSRDSYFLWPWLLGLGLTVHLALVLRRPTAEGLVLTSLLGCGLAMAALARAPLPARAFLFALPAVLACAMQGVCELRRVVGLSWFGHRVPTAAASIALLIATAAPLVTVYRQTYLCSEPNGLVEVAEVLDECKRLGPDRCAIVSRYIPATAYYQVQKGMTAPALPSSPATERVFIVADEVRSLADLWHVGVDGFDAFDSPTLWRRLGQSTVYVAERKMRRECQATAGDSQLANRP